MKKLLLLVLSFMMLAGSFPIFAEVKDFESDLLEILEAHNTAGASIAFIEADGTFRAMGIGVADQATAQPADEDTLFRIGSISKIFTSLSMLKLEEEGKLTLDDPVRSWVETVAFDNPWEQEHPVRIVHLLSHTTGWDDLHMSEYAHNDPTPVILEEAFTVYPASRTSRWVPGSRMAYCNSGPAVAAFIVEACTGLSYEDYVDTTFFQPMGMKTATFFQSEDYLKNGATLYQHGVEQPYWHILMRPSGAINASAKDMVQFLDFFINHTPSELLSQESVETMRQPQGSLIADSGLEVGHGLSHYRDTSNGFTWYGHNGGVNGGLSDFKYIPELKVGYYVAINSDNGQALFELTELLKTHLTEGLVPEVMPFSIDTTVDTSDLMGYYRAVNPRNASLHFLEYLVSVGRVETRSEGIAMIGVLDGSEDLYLPLNEKQHVDPTTGAIALTVAEDPLLGKVIHNDWLTLQPVSLFSVFGPLVFVLLWLVSTVVIVIRYVVLLIRKALKKPVKGRFWTHLFPLVQMLGIGLFIRGFLSVLKVDFLADNRLMSGFMAYGTVFYLVVSVGAIIFLLVKREKTYSHYQSLVYSVMNLVIGMYLTNMGITGYQFF